MNRKALSELTLAVGLVGPGAVGKALLEQLRVAVRAGVCTELDTYGWCMQCWSPGAPHPPIDAEAMKKLDAHHTFTTLHRSQDPQAQEGGDILGGEEHPELPADAAGQERPLNRPVQLGR